jgi:hypothetical protein
MLATGVHLHSSSDYQLCFRSVIAVSSGTAVHSVLVQHQLSASCLCSCRACISALQVEIAIHQNVQATQAMRSEAYAVTVLP